MVQGTQVYVRGVSESRATITRLETDNVLRLTGTNANRDQVSPAINNV